MPQQAILKIFANSISIHQFSTATFISNKISVYFTLKTNTMDH